MSAKAMTQSPTALPSNRSAVGYQLKIHLPGISPQISRRVLLRGDTTLAELHHIFQVAMNWENRHLHSFHRWGKDYGPSYAGGTWCADDPRRVHKQFCVAGQRQVHVYLRLWRLLTAPGAGRKSTVSNRAVASSNLPEWLPRLPTGGSGRSQQPRPAHARPVQLALRSLRPLVRR